MNVLPETADFGVFFIGDQIMTVAKKTKGEVSKFISSDDLRKAVSRLPVDSGWLPENLCRWGMTAGEHWFIAFHQAKIRRVYIGNKRLRIPCPTLVFAGRGKKYYLFAAREKEFLPGMKLYRALYPNIHPDHDICYGTNKVLEAKPEHEQDMWRLFWDAPFTSDLQGTESLVRMASEGRKEYPLERLKDTVGTTEALAKMLKGENRGRDDPV